MENEHIPLWLLQFPYRPAEPFRLRPAEHGFLRRRGGVREGQVFVGGVGVTLLAVALLQPGVFANAAQPGIQTAAALEAVDVQKGLVKCLL